MNQDDDANVEPANISNRVKKSTKDKVRFIYLLGAAFWFLIWFLIYTHINLSPYAWLIFYYGIFYFSFAIFIVNEAETIEVETAELVKINTVEQYSRSIGQLAIGVGVFVSIHRGTKAFENFKRLIIIPTVGLIFILLGPLSFFWTDDTSPDLYVLRHFKTLLYMIGLLLIAAFMIEVVHKIYWESQPLTIEEAKKSGYEVLGTVG
jgi:hypothetical protein